MAVNCSPFGPKPQFELASGAPAAGGQLFFYAAGSVNTKQTTYTDSTGSTGNANPLPLNALGQPATEIWFTAGLGYKVVYAPVGDTDPPSSPIWTIDNLRGINDTTVTASQWVAGPTPTYVGATSFTLAGDQTTEFHVGRRLKTTNTSGTIYSTITVSAYSALTTITVVNDSGVLDSGLSAVSYGLLSYTHQSIPTVNTATTATTATNIAAGAAGDILYQSAANTTAMLTAAAGVVHSTSGSPPTISKIVAADLDGAQSGSAPIYAARAFCAWNGATTGTYSPTLPFGNITSIVRNGTGDYSLNFITNMADAEYVWGATCDTGFNMSSANSMPGCNMISKSASTLRLQFWTYAGSSNTPTAADPSRCSMWVYR